MERIHELENKVQELYSLLEAFKKLNSDLAIQDVFENILLQMVQVVGAEAGTLWVLDQDHEEIVASAAYGPTASAILNIRLSKEEGIVGKVMSTGEAHLIEDVTKDPNWAKRVDQSSGFITRSMITVPLVAKGHSIGALQLLNKQGHSLFTKQDVNLALALANQSALALHNSQMYDDLYKMFMSVIKTLASVLDARDPYTAGHSERVAKYSVWIAQRLGLSSEECDELNKAALLHDIGKIGIPDEVLRKPTRLTNEEYEAMKQHTVIGATILSNMEPKSSMIYAIQTARSHHERLNGTGYPDRLAGNDIPLFARIVGVADTFDAMTTVRPYSKGHTFQEGAAELIRCKGTLFDPDIVDAFTTILEECHYEVERYKLPGRQKGN
ncbi:GAF and HD-GYP domain-containing protein [Bacillus pinisoli]|uniref:GAF and HD-GYP domain-containing protein n=1 Tax=Bacillus pinisoli TaxID=2901866 RepID=UPI001FF662D4|nr:HD domain-containing phosphohydrolase [Bacillus pinisoli]